MSNTKMVLLVAAMIGLTALGVRYWGKSFFHELVGGGPFPSAPNPPKPVPGKFGQDPETESKYEQWKSGAAGRDKPERSDWGSQADPARGEASQGEAAEAE